MKSITFITLLKKQMDYNTRKIDCSCSVGFMVLFTLIILSGNISSSYGQSNANEKKDLESIWLINGPVYYESNPFASGSPYLYEDFVKGNIFTCNQNFYNIVINYDVVDQKFVILKMPDGKSKIPILISPVLIDSFSIGDNVFINTKKYSPELPNPYALIVNKGSTQMLITYRKGFIKNYSQNNEYGMISDLKQSLYIIKNNETIIISSFRSLKKLYPDNWQEIKSYLKSNNLKFKNARVDQLNELMNFCNKLK